jgi:hypothetical protein
MEKLPSSFTIKGLIQVCFIKEAQVCFIKEAMKNLK